MSQVRIERDGPVARLRLAAPERRNALTPEMAAEVVAACDELDDDGEVGAVVVVGEGGFFCAGAHRDALAAAGADPASDEAYQSLGLIYRAFARVGELEPPTVAAVRGGAVGAGVNLAMATDLRVIAEDAKIVSGFVGLGIHPGGGHFTLVGRSGSREAAAALGLFGEGIDGRRAAEIGLAWEALPDALVEARAHELAARAGADPALARRAAATMRAELGPPAATWPLALEAERAAQMWSLRRKAERRG